VPATTLRGMAKGSNPTPKIRIALKRLCRSREGTLARVCAIVGRLESPESEKVFPESTTILLVFVSA
jgi:hypothetical protein